LRPEQFTLLIVLGLGFQLIELLLLCFIKNPQQQVAYRENPFLQVKEGVQTIRQTPQLLLMFLNVSLVFIPASAVFDKFDQPLLKNAGMPVTMIGAIYALAALLVFFCFPFCRLDDRKNFQKSMDVYNRCNRNLWSHVISFFLAKRYILC
jgi:hypothetical protein